MNSVTIDGREVGPQCTPYVIAELSANHLGSKHRAIETVAAAADAGADAIKLQHYRADTITVRGSHPDLTVSGGSVWDGQTLWDLYDSAAMPWEWTVDLIAEASRCGIAWMSSPFDPTAVDFLDALDVPAFKIASFEIIDLPLIGYAASKGRPLILSTGMATVAEIDRAMDAARQGGAPSVALLRCNSGYPARSVEMDLRAIPVMQGTWQVPVGLSDHTIGHTAAVVAVSLGACIVEKHLTLRRSDGGPDAGFSAEPEELASLVRAVGDAHDMLGTVRFGPSPHEVATADLRRSLRVVSDVPAGSMITADDVRSVRPAGGLPPEAITEVVGMVAARDLATGQPLRWADVTRPGQATIDR